MRAAWLMMAWAGCQSVEPAGGVLPPLVPPAPPPPPPVEVVKEEVKPEPAAPVAEAEPAAAEDEMSPEELLAVSMGLDPAMVAKPKDAPVAPQVGDPVPVTAPAARPAWTPSTPPQGSWGVRLVGTMSDAQPPRAILGLGSGEEIVVEPGSFVVGERVVVTAIGRDAVQIARVTPDGDRVRIDAETLTALRPEVAPARP